MTDKADTGCYYVLLRYTSSRHDSCRNSLTKTRNIQKNYNGTVVGFASEVTTTEGHWPRDRSICVLGFDSKRNAQHWVQSEPEIKQYDWLGGVDMIGVPGTNPFSLSHPWIELMDVTLDTSPEEFECGYLKPARTYFNKHKVLQGVVSSRDTTRLRGGWDPGFVIVNQYQSEDHCTAVCGSGEYQTLQGIRQNTSQANGISFRLQCDPVLAKQ